MDLLTIKFLFSVVFVLIGSLVFHISALVSGHNIYRDFSIQESTLLSIVAGIVIFLLSPISLIIFPDSNADYAAVLVQILDFEVLFAFFGCAFGLGLIFGCFTILKARWYILHWFRGQSGMKFWIYDYELCWDDFLGSVKREGEVFVQTYDELFKGSLKFSSVRNEPKEIVLDKPKRITGGWEKDIIKSEENVELLFTGSEIKRIIVPERSFKKHFESMGHISQAFYCQVLAVGFFFLSCSTHLTENYMRNLELASLESFYGWLSLIFSVLVICVLCFSVWMAKKDFNNYRSLLGLSPDIIFMALLFLLIAVLFIIFNMQISHIIILNITIFIFIFLLLYIYRIRNWLKRPIKKCFDDIKRDFEDGDLEGGEKLLEEVIQKFYLRLSCNEKGKAHIESIQYEILAECKSSHEVNKIIGMIDELDKLKNERDYLKEEDFNIILVFKSFIEEVKC
jgi:hypothetical protein